MPPGSNSASPRLDAFLSEAVVFLCSKGASYITGEVLTIDGGLIA